MTIAIRIEIDADSDFAGCTDDEIGEYFREDTAELVNLATIEIVRLPVADAGAGS